MNNKEEKAIHSFKSGLNCAQAVLTSFAEELKFDSELASAISGGFGGGMGRLQKTCGAVTGSFMALGIYNSKKYSDKRKAKENTYTMIQSFSEEFTLTHGTMECGALLNCDLRTDEGQKYFKENNLSEKICEKCVTDAIRIIETFTEK